jgi:hypothetical protein
MDRRTAIAASATAVGVMGIGYALFAPVSDEELIAEVLDRLAGALSFSEPIANPLFFGSHLAETFNQILVDNVDIRVVEVSAQIPSHRGKLALAAARVLQRYGSLDASFGSIDISVNGDAASVNAEATLMGHVSGELRRDSRAVAFDFSRVDGDWRIASARVAREQ